MEIDTKRSEGTGFDKERHIGMWVEVDGANMKNLKRQLSTAESDGYHLVNRALILDVLDVDLKHPYLRLMQEASDKISLKGNVRITPCTIGTKENPDLAVFFSVKNNGETDNVLMMTYRIFFSGLSKPIDWKMKKEIPVYPTDNHLLRLPLIGEVVATSSV